MSVSVLIFSLYVIGYCFTLVLLEYKAGHRLHYFPPGSIMCAALLWPFCLMVFIRHHIETFIYRHSRPG